ncbi:hypothetical protein [Streptomyces sp. NPDC102490]|uniref:hypothetical protein n=1 Tax=Streptomyces sp. NPDC102490 TaxID=3366183 RepID=UPI0037F14E72
MTRLDRTKKRLWSAAAVWGLVAGTVLSGAGTASASATREQAAPPGYAGPFTAACKGRLVYRQPLGIGDAEQEVYYDSAGSGTFCARTLDRMPGSHSMHVRLQREGWSTFWYDTGTFTEYAGVIYVSGANSHCAYISGWIEVGDTNYSHAPYRLCMPGVG